MTFTLDPYAARSCAVKTQHRFTPGLRPEPTEALQESFHGGVDHGEQVALELQRSGPVVDLRGRDVDEARRETERAMREGVGVILDAALRPDPVGHRSGRVDVLVRSTHGPDSSEPTYFPVLVKSHRMQERRKSGRENTWEVLIGSCADPAPHPSRTAADRALRRREADLLQLAHLYRMLADAGQAADLDGTRLGGVFGTDEVSGVDGPVVTWVDLDAPVLLTFSRSEPTGKKYRSAMERYDHEHAFRVDVATNALAGGAAKVQPIRVDECEWCPWWSTCEPIMGPQDLSARLHTAPLDVREIRALRALGIWTIDDLAEADLETLLPDYLPEVTHRYAADKRLRNAARRSRMMRDGVELERITSGPVEIPRAGLEIDFDLETYEDRAYLWGFLVHDREHSGSPWYKAFTAWEPLDDAGELALAREALQWLRELAATTETRIYHYSAYERRYLARVAGASTEWDWVDGWMDHHFVDLYPPVSQNFFGSHGLGLKVAARAGAGFHWRDADPSGLNSLQWYEEAIGAPEEEQRRAARRRLLEYNEDDVRATWELRAWLTSLD